MRLRVGGSSSDDIAFGQPDANQSIFVSTDFWDQLVEFTVATRVNLVWDLNGMNKRNADGSWDDRDARAIVERVAALNQTV